MFYDFENIDYLKRMIENVDLIQNELLKAMKSVPELNDFMNDDMPVIHSHLEHWLRENKLDLETLGYDPRNGSWGAFPIFKKGFPIKWYDSPKEFPEIFKLINGVPNPYFASFMKLRANSITKEHAHNMPGHLIFHINLFDIDNYTVLKCGDETMSFSKKGDSCLFDYNLSHAPSSFSKDNRINFAIDFIVPDKFQLIPLKDRSRII